MRIALDSNGNRVFVDDSSRDETYFCPTCGEPLTARRGSVRVHHFAHRQGTECIDDWHYSENEMSEWHRTMQDLFDPSCQEVVVSCDGKTHRADVLCNGTVIEFQHSPINILEVDDRIRFFLALGYRVVWVFDLSGLVNVNVQTVCSDDVSILRTEWSSAWHRVDHFDFSNADRLALWFAGYGDNGRIAFRVKYPVPYEPGKPRMHAFRMWYDSGLDLSPGSQVSVDDFFDMQDRISMCRDICSYHGNCRG